MNNTEWMRQRLLAGVHEKAPSPQELRHSEWCPEFIGLMLDRMIMGAFRYGSVHDIRPTQKNYAKYLDEALDRTIIADDDQILEPLVDAANMLMVAYMVGKRRGLKLGATDDGKHIGGDN